MLKINVLYLNGFYRLSTFKAQVHRKRSVLADSYHRNFAAVSDMVTSHMARQFCKRSSLNTIII